MQSNNTVPWDEFFEKGTWKQYGMYQDDLSSGGKREYHRKCYEARTENNAKKLREWYPELQKIHDELVQSTTLA